jgi:hypothetical protein
LAAAKILSELIQAKYSRHAQRPRKHPAPTREFQAIQAGMQIGAPAGKAGSRVGLDDLPNRHEAKQAGLDLTSLAAYTGPDYRPT